VTKKKLALIAGRANIELAEEVAATLDETLLDANCAEFANGELHCKLQSSVRGTDVFSTQSHTGHDGRSINDSIMEHLIMVDAARRASAKRITVVMPFFGYAARTASPRVVSPSPPAWWPTCSRWRAPSGSCRSTCTPGRSRASS